MSGWVEGRKGRDDVCLYTFCEEFLRKPWVIFCICHNSDNCGEIPPYSADEEMAFGAVQLGREGRKNGGRLFGESAPMWGFRER
ncbi:hypothetical protein VFPPC_15283 [Pochonia chlamydosporia 170]|uniref:Uncharacterized protein n=1 Tax=Pochonia chlamydosporia 170 TaxID=1380566 RepID=A0A179G655_METCM|nr:hypothetical protein VFPPC_15283 [Pochonia chlamydosporia 170]OAQ73295.1 hypothetical protein VFPPC_15283 [Pochonia chlamydosporia 170]